MHVTSATYGPFLGPSTYVTFTSSDPFMGSLVRYVRNVELARPNGRARYYAPPLYYVYVYYARSLIGTVN